MKRWLAGEHAAHRSVTLDLDAVQVLSSRENQ